MKGARPSPWRAVGAALLLAAACPSKDGATPPEAADPFFQKLKAAPSAPRPLDHDALAQAAQGATQPKELVVPSDAAATLDSLSVRVTELELSQRVQGKRLALSTADTFLRVTVGARGAGVLDPAGATLRRQASSYSVARDVMRLAEAPLTIQALDGGQSSLRLFFELPMADVAPGLELLLPSERGELKLRVQ